MPLTLITGPANAAKAGAVLERLRASLSREPVLVVPTSADERHYARELAGAGLVFGADVTTFPRLIRDIARKAGVRGRPLRPARARPGRAGGDPRRARCASSPPRRGARASRTRWPTCSPSSSARWPGRRASAPPCAPGARPAPPRRTRPSSRRSTPPITGGWRRCGAVDEDGLTLLALRGLREAWDGRPLLLYGFDDLSPAQLDLVETLVRHTDTDVTVAVTYEPGRAAMAGSATTVELLKPLAREHVILEPRSEHYAQSARGALHHLERGLFEPAGARVPPNGAVRLLEAGGERAEAELVGASVLELLRDGMAPEDIAVLVRSNVELFAQVFETYAIPVARERRVPFAHTRLGAGLLAFARAALGEGTAMDVVTWLRTPGKLGRAGRTPRADDAARSRRRRRRGPSRPTGSRSRSARPPRRRTARDARYHWARLGGRELVELDALAAAEGVEAFLAALLAEARGDLDRAARPSRRRARSRRRGRRPRRPPSCAARSGSCWACTSRTRRWWASAQDILAALAATEVRETESVADGAPGVLLADPLAIRARRFRALLVCGLQEGELPRRPQPEPFLDDGARSALAVASGLVLGRHEATLPRERSLFYACVSRPEEALFLQLPQLGRGGRPAAALAVPGRRARALHRRAVGGARPAAAGRDHVEAGGGPDAARAAPLAGRRGRGAAAGRARRAGRPGGPARCSPRATASRRAGWRRSRPAR